MSTRDGVPLLPVHDDDHARRKILPIQALEICILCNDITFIGNDQAAPRFPSGQASVGHPRRSDEAAQRAA